MREIVIGAPIRVVNGPFVHRQKPWPFMRTLNYLPGPTYFAPSENLRAIRAAYLAWRDAVTRGADQASLDELRQRFEALLF